MTLQVIRFTHWRVGLLPLLILCTSNQDAGREGIRASVGACRTRRLTTHSPYNLLPDLLMAQLSQAAILKNEGNALFVKNDFSKAYKKYTAAINLDKENAVLYCNRAACAFDLNRYVCLIMITCVVRNLSSR